MIHRILLASDFAPEGEQAFRLALALAAACRARLEIVHVGRPGERADWSEFPRVREVLADWGLLPRGAAKQDVPRLLGIDVAKVEVHAPTPTEGLTDYVLKHRPDVLVAASHGRTGLGAWLGGSVALETMRRTALPSLILGPAAAAPLDAATGRLRIAEVLLPVSVSPSPLRARRSFSDLFGFAGVPARPVHVIEDEADAAAVRSTVPDAVLLAGPVVEGILEEAARREAALIAMPTKLRKGAVEAIRGGTTQRVLHAARCPVLALPD